MSTRSTERARWVIFLAYPRLARPIVDALRQYLREKRLHPWSAPHDVPLGTDYADATVKIMSSVACMVLLVCRETARSAVVRREVEYAVTHNIPIIPFKLDTARPKGWLELHLQTMQWLAANPKAPEDSFPPLLAAIRAQLKRRSHGSGRRSPPRMRRAGIGAPARHAA